MYHQYVLSAQVDTSNACALERLGLTGVNPVIRRSSWVGWDVTVRMGTEYAAQPFARWPQTFQLASNFGSPGVTKETVKYLFLFFSFLCMNCPPSPEGVPKKTAIRMLRARLGDPILGNFRPSRLSFGSFFGHLAPFEQIWSYKIWSQNIFENLVSNLVSMTPRRWRMFNSMQSQIKWTALFKRRLTVEPLGERLPSVVAYCLLRQEEVGAPQKSGHYVILCYRSSPLLLLA